MKARTIGIVGGLGPESTIDYYRMLIAAFKERGIDDYRSILINSIELDKALAFLNAGDLDGLAAFVVEAVERLAKGGADFALIAANTPHIVFDEIARRSPIPLVSIVASVFDAAKQIGSRRVGLIGTGYTMRSGFYGKYFDAHGIPLVVPGEPDLAYVHAKYLDELLEGQFLDETRLGLLAVLERMREQHEIDAVILGGTELPLILRGATYPLPFLDSGKIHVDAAVSRAIQ